MLALIGDLLYLYLLVLIAYSILSLAHLLRPPAVRLAGLQDPKGLASICEPVLRPIRRIIPPVRVGGVGLDLSVLVVFLVIDCPDPHPVR